VNELTSPAFALPAGSAQLTFRNNYNLEAGSTTGYDGGVLEIAINNGAFNDILAAGGSFVSGGYNGTIATRFSSPIAGRNAWSGNSGGYLTSVAALPASAAGQNVQLKWRFGADDNTAGTGPNPGWYVDNISVTGSYNCSLAPNVKSRADFDGDGKTDLSVFRPSEGNWYLNRSTAGFVSANWGLSSDLTTPGDFDGDGKADLAVWRPSSGVWFVLQSLDGQMRVFHWGLQGDV